MFEGGERTNCEVLKVGPAEIKFLYSPFGNRSLRLRIGLFKRGPTQLLQPFDLKLAHQVLNLDFGYKKALPPTTKVGGSLSPKQIEETKRDSLLPFVPCSPAPLAGKVASFAVASPHMLEPCPFLPRQILVGIGLIEICACLCLMQAGVARHRWGELAPDFWVHEIEETRAAMIFDEYCCIYSIFFWDRKNGASPQLWVLSDDPIFGMWNIGFPGTPGGGSVQLWGACPGDPRDFHLEADDGVRLPVDAEQSTPGVSKISAVLFFLVMAQPRTAISGPFPRRWMLWRSAKICWYGRSTDQICSVDLAWIIN